MVFGNVNLHNTELVISAGFASQLIEDGVPQIAFAGRSNVGKSSLINSLLGRKKLARVSSAPGKTVTVNYYFVDKKLYLVDLPGYGYAKRSGTDIEKWSRLTQAYFQDNPALKLVLQLVDPRAGITADDRTMLRWLSHYALPYIVVVTKCDKLTKAALAESAGRILGDPDVLPGTECVLYSSLKGQGREALVGRILEKLAS